MSAADHLSGQFAAGPVFYHGSSARLSPGDHITPPSERGADAAHPVIEGSVPNSPDHTYMTEWAKDARHWAGRSGHVYKVEPMGRYYQDPNGSEGDHEVRGHLLITGVHK